MNSGNYLLGAGEPAAIAVVDGGREYSYTDLRAAAAEIAAALTALQLPAGSRVAILGPNSFFWVAAYLAVLRLELLAVPMSDKSTAGDIRRNLDIVGCAAALVDRRYLRRDSESTAAVPVLTDEVLGSGATFDWPTDTTDAGADAVLMFTSGTTNIPKAVRITHRNIRANTESIVSYLGLQRSDRALAILPFFYCYGASVMHTHLSVGATLVLCNSFAFPETAVNMLEQYECTVFAGVPSSFQLLLRTTTFAKRALPALRVIQQAGGKLAPVMIEELVNAQPQARLFVMYGQTEATARLSYLPPEDLTEKLGSIGKGIPGVELRVLNDDLQCVGIGEKGEIYASGANISPGYFGDPDNTATKFTPSGLRTGDLAVIDEDGYIFIVDRRDDFIKSWGYRVASQEVEAAALRMPQLVSAAAVGVPDDEAGEAVVLFVTAAPGAQTTPEDVLTACRAHLPKHMVPKTVLIIDALPLNASGKIAKTILRERAAVSTGTKS